MSESIPESCPTCGTKVPAGAARCPGCGRVFGEDNRCPHCNAIAAVRPAGSGFVCVACGKPREKRPGTTVVGEAGPRRSRVSVVPEKATAGLRSGARRLFGMLAIGGAVISAALATLIFGTGLMGLTLALGFGAAGTLLGLASLRRARALDEGAKARERQLLEQRVELVAQRHGGDVTAAIVAQDLGVAASDAERVLGAMVDGIKVELEVDEKDGTMHYVFPAARRASVAKMRVEAPADGADEAALDEEARAEIERQVERVKKGRI